MLIYAGQGDIGSVIAMQKMVELRNSISLANFAIKKAKEEKNSITKYALYRSAILDYNCCYDFVLQIVYFGFDFCSPIKSDKDYIEQMRDYCKLSKTIECQCGKRVSANTSFKDKIEELKSTNPQAKDFFKKLRNFRQSLRKNNVDISDWANTIKHRGGFIVDEVIDTSKMACTITIDKNDEVVFDSSYTFHPISFSEIERRLQEQNVIIVDFLSYLQNSLFGDTQNIEGVNKSNKLFSANVYNKEDFKGSKTFLTNIKD